MVVDADRLAGRRRVRGSGWVQEGPAEEDRLADGAMGRLRVWAATAAAAAGMMEGLKAGMAAMMGSSNPEDGTALGSMAATALMAVLPAAIRVGRRGLEGTLAALCPASTRWEAAALSTSIRR